jgi:hypothetical protein
MTSIIVSCLKCGDKIEWGEAQPAAYHGTVGFLCDGCADSITHKSKRRAGRY